ncbi:hypothetical protein PPERSA_00814 [Pseudocohnilembus persalinus]|uniref:Uncharacterized protein n=1 Tax=Pseudocohnilembus persalinus TaxID=266149 RepID=A0A0V0QFV7_PSEPJ|nr:hypothetical protein PPERSA_00814 [Pseudocohnilembus persalinus]|eukprot:KRX01066.1 hypothetical protein PPERSA_00814 [Pseudocohnilembus persalinus]
MSSSQGNFSKTLGVQRWIYHKHHGDPFSIEQSSTKYSNNYKSIGGETQKLFFESFTPRNGAGEQLNYRPGSSKNEILIRRKAGLSRPQTATNLKKIKKINLNTEDDSDQEILRKTKKINRIQKEKNDTKF